MHVRFRASGAEAGSIDARVFAQQAGEEAWL